MFRLMGLSIIGAIQCVRHAQTLIVLLSFYRQDHLFYSSSLSLFYTLVIIVVVFSPSYFCVSIGVC